MATKTSRETSGPRQIRLSAKAATAQLSEALGVDVLHDPVIASWSLQRWQLLRIGKLSRKDQGDWPILYRHLLQCEGANGVLPRELRTLSDYVRSKAWDDFFRSSTSPISKAEYRKHVFGCGQCASAYWDWHKLWPSDLTGEGLYLWMQKRTIKSETALAVLVEKLRECKVHGFSGLRAAVAKTLRGARWRNHEKWRILNSHMSPCRECHWAEVCIERNLQSKSGDEEWLSRYGIRNPAASEWAKTDLSTPMPPLYLPPPRRRGRPIERRINELNGELVREFPQLVGKPRLFLLLECLCRVWDGRNPFPLIHDSQSRESNYLSQTAAKSLRAAVKMNAERSKEGDNTRLILSRAEFERQSALGAQHLLRFPKVKDVGPVKHYKYSSRRK